MITTLDIVRAAVRGEVLPTASQTAPSATEWTDTLTPGAWAAQAREDRSVFTTAVALVLMNPRQRQWVLAGFEDGDLQAGDLEDAAGKFMETHRRYEVALMTLQAAHNVLANLIKETR